MRLAEHPKIWQSQRNQFFKPEIFKTQWLEKAWQKMQDCKRICFVIYWQGKLVGSSSYYDIDEEHKHLSIGYTWYHPDFWGSQLNPTVKYLMLNYAFEELRMHRVAFTVDHENFRSQAALTKLGIAKEGILRKHMIRADGSHRDTVVFAVTSDDWPTVKSTLLDKLDYE